MLLLLAGKLLFYPPSQSEAVAGRAIFWNMQSIDTVKFSRDLSREKLHDRFFNLVIDEQIRNIAETGATHVAIGTPYDEEFLPVLQKWVSAARKYNIHVWFRGNFSGWEGWFDYPRIDRETHLTKTRDFIVKNVDLFEDGDIFSSCPECENGGPGDPRNTGDVVGHRQFLIEEYQLTRKAFGEIGKHVFSNYNSMNADVAHLVMDRKTTSSLHGIVVIDHYVADIDQLVLDIKRLAKDSGGKVVLGEFGAPILDLHGEMTEREQAAWIERAFVGLLETDEVVGVNYWTNVGGSTQLWDTHGKARAAVDIVKGIYDPYQLVGMVRNEAGDSVPNAIAEGKERRTVSNASGYFQLPYFDSNQSILVKAKGYRGKTVALHHTDKVSVVLEKESEDLWFAIRKFVVRILPFK